MKTSNKIIIGAILLATSVVFYIPISVIAKVNKSIAESGSFAFNEEKKLASEFISDSSKISNMVIGKGEIKNKIYNLEKPFSHIVVSGAARLELTQKDNYSIELSDFENLLSYTEINIISDTLIINYNESANIKNLKTTVKISMPNLKSIDCNNTKNEIKSIGNLDLDSLNLTVNGNTDFRIRGKVNNLFYTINGKSYAPLTKLICKNATYNISGFGIAETNVTDTMNLNVSGYGRIFQNKTPKNLYKNISGSCEVNIHKTK